MTNLRDLPVAFVLFAVACGGAVSPAAPGDSQGPIVPTGTQIDGGASSPDLSTTPVSTAADAGSNPPADASSAPQDFGPPGVLPTAPTDFTMTHQGANDIALSWTAAQPGMNGIDHYKIYRNGVAYATATGTTYSDTKATGATTPGYGPEPSHAATTYTYDVSAVDKAGKEGPKADVMTAWMFHGSNNWSEDYNYGTITTDYTDTSGGPTDGKYDVKIVSGGGGWQPFSGAPFLTTNPSIWCMEVGAFHYMTIDIKPTKANSKWALNIISRAPPGDVFNTAAVTLPGNFGPAPEVGKWATYKIPFLVPGSADGVSLEVGTGTFEGSISGNKLTVTKMDGGLNVQGASWISGKGIAPDTYISGPSSGDGGPGSEYTVSPSQNVASTTITTQRTNMYKFSLIDKSNDGDNTYYVQRVGFTTK